MKYLFVVLAAVFFCGCHLVYYPNYLPPTGVQVSDMVWSSDGNHIIILADSFTTNNSAWILRLYDKSGTYVRSYELPANLHSNNIWACNDDSSIFQSTYSGGDYTVQRFYFGSGTTTAIAGGEIYAQSADRNHLFIGPYSYQTQGNNFLTVDVSGNKPRLQKSWSDPSPEYQNGMWAGSNSIGYFRRNSFNLIDFVITDTSGVKLDSFDVSKLSNLYSAKPYHSPGFIYFAGPDGILKYDSLTKSSSWLTEDGIYENDISPDGSFIVYEKSGAPPNLMIINTKTGVSKSLANSASFLKISSAGDQLAYIDDRNSSDKKVVVIPVSAP